METPVIVGITVAILGALGGIAAILKVNSDNSNSISSGARAVSEGAKTVIELMNERLEDAEANYDEHAARLDALEDYVSHFDAWADKLVDILDRAVLLLPEALKVTFEAESSSLKSSRPKRSPVHRRTRVTVTKN